MKLSREECEELLWGDNINFEIISDDIVSKSRWAVHHKLIVKYKDGKFYRTSYSEGATEYQDQDYWDYKDEIEFTEVKPVEKTVIVYEDV